MAKLTIADFAGQVPRTLARLLAGNQAQEAVNSRLTSGDLEPWHGLRFTTTLSKGERPAYYTSRPYPLTPLEEFDVGQVELTALKIWAYEFPLVDAGQIELVNGTLRDLLVEHEFGPDVIDTAQVEVLSGTLRDLLVTYDIPPEEVDASQVEIIDGLLVVKNILYTNWPAEGIDPAQVEITSGTLA